MNGDQYWIKNIFENNALTIITAAILNNTIDKHIDCRGTAEPTNRVISSGQEWGDTAVFNPNPFGKDVTLWVYWIFSDEEANVEDAGNMPWDKPMDYYEIMYNGNSLGKETQIYSEFKNLMNEISYEA